jgi:hypothetical protein
MMRPVVLAALLAALLAAGAAHAQSSDPPAAPATLAYKLAPGDTLPYSFRYRVATERRTGQGPQISETDTRGQLRLAVGAADSVRAWFDTIGVTMAGTGGRGGAPPVRGVTGQQWTLSINRVGETQILAAPPLPEPVQRMTGVGTQMTALLPRLPGRELKVGDSWSDSVITRARGSRSEGRSTTNEVTGFRVTRDAVIEGRRIVFIEGKGKIRNTTEREINNGLAQITIEGDLTRTIQFAPDEGRVVRYVERRETWSKTQNYGQLTYGDHVISELTIALR